MLNSKREIVDFTVTEKLQYQYWYLFPKRVFFFFSINLSGIFRKGKNFRQSKLFSALFDENFGR